MKESKSGVVGLNIVPSSTKNHPLSC